MLYHYTSLNAFESILRYVKTLRKMCFWATRYDSFVDNKEFMLGVEIIRKLLPEVESTLSPDRRISHLIDWNMIKDNTNMLYPYIVSFTSRFNNEYMWDQYAKEYGVVLEIDDSITMKDIDVPLFSLTPCVYVDEDCDETIISILREEYNRIGYDMLLGPNKFMAFKLLKDYPQVFVKIIAMGLIAYTAPRIKDSKDYKMEEETRFIIPMPIPNYIAKIKGYETIISSLGIDPNKLKELVAMECSRQLNNGRIMYYRKLYLPIKFLKGVYVKDQCVRKEVEKLLRKLNLNVLVKLC